MDNAKFKPGCKRLEFQLALSSLNRTQISQLHISECVPHANNICVGVVRDGALHMSPLTEVMQLRPSFKNMELRGEIVEDMDISDDQDDEDDSGALEPSGKSSGLQQVHMKRKESERAQAARLQSYSYLKSIEDAEAFRDMRVFAQGAHISFSACASKIMLSAYLFFFLTQNLLRLWSCSSACTM